MKLLFSLFFAGVLSLNAQDSAQYKKVIPFEQLNFHSSYERALFSDLYAGKEIDYLAFFISADSAGNQKQFDAISEKIKAYCDEKTASGIKTKSQKKQVKVLYKEVHTQYLEKYEYQNSFVSIFDDGRYNCVSGSALFARVFDEMGIEYAIQEFPTHVMLIAYADGEQIAVETTDPTTGYLAFTPKMKKEYADYLRQSKLISEAEYLEGPEAVFDKNYLVNDVVNFRQLAGIQYNNNAVYNSEKANGMPAALRFASKAFALYPAEPTFMALVQSAASIIENGDFKDTNRTRCFELLSRFRGEFITDDYLKSQFAAVSANSLIAQRDTSSFGKAYRAITNNSNDSVFNRDIALLYNVEMGRFYGLNGQFDQSVKYFLPAFTIDSTNLEVSALTVHVLLSWLREFDLQEGLVKLDSVLLRYPAVAEKADLKTARADAYLRMFWNAYRANNGSLGDENRNKFETLVKPETFKKFKIDREILANAYNEAAIYYYKKSQFKKVQEILKKALTLDPDNYRLKDSLSRFR